MGTPRRCESERARAVVALQLRAESFVPLQDVEHVAQHFEHHAVGLRPHRRRARIVVHASHLAEEFAGPKFGDRDCRRADRRRRRWE